MSIMEYSIEYEEYTVTYEIEGDVDGNHAFIRSIKNEQGELIEVDKETENDMRFIAESEYSDLQFRHYMKTGEMI